MINSLKGVAVLALAAIGAASANSATIVLESAGTWTVIGAGPNWTQAESVIQPVSTTDGLPELDNLAVTVTGSNTTTPTAVAVYSNAADTQMLTLDWTITDQEYAGNDNDIFSMDGTWVYGGGTGGYAGLIGSGTFGVTQTIEPGTDSGFSGTVLAGDLQATPEPASYAVLGIGALGLIRRRKSA